MARFYSTELYMTPDKRALAEEQPLPETLRRTSLFTRVLCFLALGRPNFEDHWKSLQSEQAFETVRSRSCSIVSSAITTQLQPGGYFFLSYLLSIVTPIFFVAWSLHCFIFAMMIAGFCSQSTICRVITVIWLFTLFLQFITDQYIQSETATVIVALQARPSLALVATTSLKFEGHSIGLRALTAEHYRESSRRGPGGQKATLHRIQGSTSMSGLNGFINSETCQGTLVKGRLPRLYSSSTQGAGVLVGLGTSLSRRLEICTFLASLAELNQPFAGAASLPAARRLSGMLLFCARPPPLEGYIHSSQLLPSLIQPSSKRQCKWGNQRMYTLEIVIDKWDAIFHILLNPEIYIRISTDELSGWFVRVFVGALITYVRTNAVLLFLTSGANGRDRWYGSGVLVCAALEEGYVLVSVSTAPLLKDGTRVFMSNLTVARHYSIHTPIALPPSPNSHPVIPSGTAPRTTQYIPRPNPRSPQAFHLPWWTRKKREGDAGREDVKVVLKMGFEVVDEEAEDERKDGDRVFEEVVCYPCGSLVSRSFVWFVLLLHHYCVRYMTATFLQTHFGIRQDIGIGT
ncbi:hypothetical protein BD769DRAFT_1396978 [Suillus cothurnatus]|nr:hypothetical protein BD769DRAFT_1396978 [Suillus cothurnatus]